MDIIDLNWNISKENLKNQLKDGICGVGYIFGQCLLWGKECSATFLYEDSFEKIKRVEISFYKMSGLETEAFYYKNILEILKELLGEPQHYVNTDPFSLEQLTDVYKQLQYDKLPKIIWYIDGNQIVHRFKDYWGMIPDTYIEK